MTPRVWLDDFADWTIQTARYPEAGSGSLTELLYLVLGLCGEVGECLNARKKMIRDGASSDPLAGELADVLWYACRLARASSIGIEAAQPRPPREDLDLLLLLLYTTAGELAIQVYQARQLPDPLGLAQVVDLALSALVWLGHDPQLVLAEKQVYLLSRTDQGRLCD